MTLYIGAKGRSLWGFVDGIMTTPTLTSDKATSDPS